MRVSITDDCMRCLQAPEDIDMEKTTDLVIGSSLGSELSNEEAGVLADLMSYRDVTDGEFLIEEGASDDTLHVLLSGKFEVVKHTGAGETASLAILRPGSLAGEMSFVDGAVHTVGLRALSDSRTSATVRPRSASAAGSTRIWTWRSAPPQTSTLDTPGTVSIRVRTLSETKSRIMSMSRPRGLPSSGATRKYMKELLENEVA